MSAAESSPSELLRRKQEQWEREKAEMTLWFPFGSPGGGAPNRKPRSQSNTPSQESAPQIQRSQKSPVPFSAEQKSPYVTTSSPPSTQMDTSTHSTHSSQQQYSYAYLPPMPMQSQTPCGPAQQFVYTQSPHGHPIPVEVIQGPHGPVIRYPLALLPTSPNAPVNLTSTSPQSSLPSSYTEQWTSHIPYWCTKSPSDMSVCVEAQRTQLPPINGDQQNGLYVDQPLLHSTVSSSFSSLNSCRQQLPSETDDHKQRQNDLPVHVHPQSTRDPEVHERNRDGNHNVQSRQTPDKQTFPEESQQKTSEAEGAKTKNRSAEPAQCQIELLERFKREAEQLKKAKLYRHVMQSPDAPKYGKELFGNNGVEQAARLLSEIDALDRQQKLQDQIVQSRRPPTSSSCAERRRSLPPKHHQISQEHSDRPIRPALTENNANKQEISIQPNSAPKLERGRSFRISGSPRTHSTPRRSDSMDRIGRAPTTPPQPARTSARDKEAQRNSKSLSRARRTASRTSSDSSNRLPSAQNEILYSYDAEAESEMAKSVDSGVGQTDNDNDQNDRRASLDNTDCAKRAVAIAASREPPTLPLPKNNLLKSKEFGGSAGLFEPVLTRNRNKMRVSQHSTAATCGGSVDVEKPFTPPTIITPASCDGFETPGGMSKNSTFSIDDTPNRGNFLRSSATKARSRANTTSKLGLNESDSSPPRQSAFAKKIAEQSTTSIDTSAQDISSPATRRQFDTNSLSPGLLPSRLRLSCTSLCGSENGDADKSASTSPKPFNSFLSRTPQYRSFNMKRNKDNQQRILDQLSQLREQLKDKQKRIGQTLYAELDRSTQNHDSVAA